jgi:hypothetical protein
MLSSRRHFLRSAAAMSLAAPAYATLSGCATGYSKAQSSLVADPEGWLDLPEGFSYHRFSLTGEVMDDGLLVPSRHDGMGAFAVEGEPDLTCLIRNHEVKPGRGHETAFENAETTLPNATNVYDYDPAGRPLGGGTTTLIYNTKARSLERSHLSLAGTSTNCSGGITPWGSWLTCEETFDLPGDGGNEAHGYVFEVPSTEKGLAKPIPLKAMGRFKHEAAAVDPRTGIVYMTEDHKEGLTYRFIPNTPGRLIDGGRLQALALRGQESADTRGWSDQSIPTGQALDVRWIDVEEVTSPNSDLHIRGHKAGAALFARGEGMAWSIDRDGGSVYFAATTGGKARKGQIWRYIPSAQEGQDGEDTAPGQLLLHFESPDAQTMDMCDNIVAAPWGHLVICEDGDGENFVHGLSPDGRVYTIARNAHEDRNEFAGACFSPDGTTLFVNIQTPGATYAITGPWARLALT